MRIAPLKHTKFDPGVETAAGTEQVKRRLSIITLARPVDISLGKHKQGCSLRVPLQLDLIALEETLLRDGRAKLGHEEHPDAGGLSLQTLSAVNPSLETSTR